MIRTDRLDVYAYRSWRSDTCHGFLAMTDVEVYFRMSLYKRFPVLPIFKDGELSDMIFLAEGFAQQQISPCTGFPSQLIFKLQHLLATLL
jgi:hypothetical protein